MAAGHRIDSGRRPPGVLPTLALVPSRNWVPAADLGEVPEIGQRLAASAGRCAEGRLRLAFDLPMPAIALVQLGPE